MKLAPLLIPVTFKPTTNCSKSSLGIKILPNSSLQTPDSPTHLESFADCCLLSQHYLLNNRSNCNSTLEKIGKDFKFSALDALSNAAILHTSLRNQHQNIIINDTKDSLVSSLNKLDLSSIRITIPILKSNLIYKTHLNGIQVYICWINQLEMQSIVPSKFYKNGKKQIDSIDQSQCSIESRFYPLIRRIDTNMVNASLLLGIGEYSEQEIEAILSLERIKETFGVGSSLQGTWVPLEKARSFAKSLGMKEILFFKSGFELEALFDVGPGISNTKKLIHRKSSIILPIKGGFNVQQEQQEFKKRKIEYPKEKGEKTGKVVTIISVEKKRKVDSDDEETEPDN